MLFISNAYHIADVVGRRSTSFWIDLLTSTAFIAPAEKGAGRQSSRNTTRSSVY